MIVQIIEIIIKDCSKVKMTLEKDDNSGFTIETSGAFYIETQAEAIKFIEAIKDVAGIEDKI